MHTLYLYLTFLCCVFPLIWATSSESSSITNRSYWAKNPIKLRVSGSPLLPYLSFKNNVSSNTTQPGGVLVRYIEESAKHCRFITTTSYSKLDINSSDDIEVAVRKHPKNNVMLYFPVFSDRDEKRQFGRDFIPLFESPGISVLDIGRTEERGINAQTLESLKSACPIIVELILAATIAGFVIWFVDNRKNEDFSGGFFAGSAAGIWWSFVTMTTVGYGDKTPKTLIGRVLAVIWMIVGTIFLSVFTARITSQLAMYKMEDENHLVDTQVAVPLGMQNFLDNEFNLGAEYIDVDNEIILNKITNPAADSPKILEKVKYAIVHDHDYLKMFFLKANKSADMRIKKTIEHPLSLGMVITGKMRRIDCWQKEIFNKIASHKAEMRSFYREALKPPKQQDEGFGDYKTVVYLAAANGVLIVLGSLLEMCKKLKNKLAAKT